MCVITFSFSLIHGSCGVVLVFQHISAPAMKLISSWTDNNLSINFIFIYCALWECLQFSKQEFLFLWTQHLRSLLVDILFSYASPIISCFLFCPDLLPCFGKRIAGQLNENGQPCQPTVGKHGGGSLTFSQSRLNVSLQWPAVQLQLMCAPPYKAFIGSMPQTLLTVETHTHTHLLLWFCLTRLSHSAQSLPVIPIIDHNTRAGTMPVKMVGS